MGRLCVSLDAYVLPVVNELTGVTSQTLFVPLDSAYKKHATSRVSRDSEQGQSIDELCLQLDLYGPMPDPADILREEQSLRADFAKRHLRNANFSKEGYTKAAAYALDASGPLWFTFAFGALAMYGSTPIEMLIAAAAAIPPALLSFVFSAAGATELREAAKASRTTAVMDHFSTDLSIVQGNDEELAMKVAMLHDYFSSLDGPSRKINEGLSSHAKTIGLPLVVSEFYKERNKQLAKTEGTAAKLIRKGIVRAGWGDLKSMVREDGLGVISHIARSLPKVASRKAVDVHIPIIALPTIGGYDVLHGDITGADISDLAFRLSRAEELRITYDVMVPGTFSHIGRSELERDVCVAIHDNVYQNDRLKQVFPAYVYTKVEKHGRLLSMAGGGMAFAAGAVSAAFGLPFAAVPFFVGGGYLFLRSAVLSRGIEKLHTAQHERLIKGLDLLQERLKEGGEFVYHVDPQLSLMDGIIRDHSVGYDAYRACMQEAKARDFTALSGVYLQKALAVQPLEYEPHFGIMEIPRIKEGGT